MARELDGRRRELCDWLTANNIDDLNTVPLDSDLTISTDTLGVRTLHYEVYVHVDGKTVVDDRGEGPAVERRSVPLLVEPPDWWEPYEKPTRAALLAAVERVRAQHTRVAITDDCYQCSQRDYPDYSVPWPCPTIRALDEEQP